MHGTLRTGRGEQPHYVYQEPFKSCGLTAVDGGLAVRVVYTAGIARDETRHAALAWAVDGWSQTLLHPAARRRVREARREAIEGLVNAPLADLPRDERAQAGLPDEDDASRMAGELGTALV